MSAGIFSPRRRPAWLALGLAAAAGALIPVYAPAAVGLSFVALYLSHFGL